MLNGSAILVVGSARLGSARLGSARLGSAYSAVFSVRQVLFHTIYNESIAGDRVYYALASVFCVYRKGGGLMMKSFAMAGKHIFSG